MNTSPNSFVAVNVAKKKKERNKQTKQKNKTKQNKKTTELD